MSEQSPGVSPPPPSTPPLGVSPTSDNPGTPGAQPAPGAPQPAAYAQGQPGYGAPPAPPPPRQPSPFLENLKADLIGTFPSPSDAPQGKLWAILSYLPGVFIPLWLVPLVRRNNHLSLFHAKQMLGFAVLQIPVTGAFFLVRMVLPKMAVLNVLVLIASILLGLGFLAVAIVGLLGAIRGQVKPLPLIGRTTDKMLRSLTVCPPVANPEPQLAYWMRVAPPPARPQAPQSPAPAQQQWQSPPQSGPAPQAGAPQSAPAQPPTPGA